MTHHDDLDRELVTWFSDDAARRMPSGLLGAIDAAAVDKTIERDELPDPAPGA